MPRTRASVLGGRILISLSLLSLALLGGCDASAPATSTRLSTATSLQPTPKPLAVTVKQLALPGYGVEDAFATNTGFVFTATGKDAQGQQASLLYYHDLQTGTNSLADTAPWDPHRCTGGCSGTNGTIWIEAVAGDIAVYAHAGVSGAAGELRALQVGRWRQFTLDTSTAYAAGGESLPIVAATDGQHVAWERLMGNTSGVGARVGASTIHVFDTSVGAESVGFETDAGYYYLLGFAGGNLVYAKSPENAAQGDQIPIFIQPLAGASAVQVAAAILHVGPTGDNSYIAWDQINSDGSGTTSVLSLSATSQQPKTYPCTRPQLSGQYMACVVFNRNLDLFNLTTGDSATFASPSANFVTISSGQMVWWDGKMVNYVTLPQ